MFALIVLETDRSLKQQYNNGAQVCVHKDTKNLNINNLTCFSHLKWSKMVQKLPHKNETPQGLTENITFSFSLEYLGAHMGEAWIQDSS